MSDGGAQFRQLFLGSTYVNFKIYFYEPGTSTAKNVWKDEARVAPASVIDADASGMAHWYADGDYDMEIKDSTGTTTYWTWKNVKMTSDTATMWEGNHGTAYPTAAAANLYQLFAKHDASDALLEVGVDLAKPSGHQFAPLTHTLDVRWFGAIGDGVADDSVAFQRMVEHVNGLAGGVAIVIPEGAYVIQWDYTLPDNKRIFQSCTGISIIGQGATIKIKDGAQVGYLGGEDRDEAWAFSFEQCQHVYVRDLELDGNLAMLTLHGSDGKCHGLHFKDCETVLVDSCHAHDFGTDGVLVQGTIAGASKRVTLRNVQTIKNRRTGFAITGGEGVHAENCNFNETGKGAFSTPLKVGVDIEFEGQPIKDVTFVNCSFEKNANMGLICDSNVLTEIRDVLFVGCRFEGLAGDGYAVMAKNETVRFLDCNFWGEVGAIYGEAVQCHFENDDAHFASGLKCCLSTDADIATRLRDCTFRATSSTAPGRRLIDLRGSLDPETRKVIEGCTFTLDGEALGDPAGPPTVNIDCGVVGGTAILRRCEFIKTGVDPDYAVYFLSLAYNSAFDVDCRSNSPKLKIGSAGIGAGGIHQESWRSAHYQEATLPSGNVTPYLGSRLLEILDLNGFVAVVKQLAATAEPTSGGPWDQGSIVWNTAPTEDGNNMVLLGWVCTTSGDFGNPPAPVFKPMYISTVSPAT